MEDEEEDYGLEDNEDEYSQESEEAEPISSSDPRWQKKPAHSQRQLNEAQTKLGSNLTDMLINLYNGKPTSEFQDQYATIAQIIDNQKKLSQQTKGPEITSKALFELFC